MYDVVLLLGPYIGSFKEEVTNFLPYARWLSSVVKHEKLYISTHLNRFFLYDDFVNVENNMIPVYTDLTRNELNQRGYVNNSISRKNFDILVKDFKDTVINKYGCRRKDIELYGLDYVKSTPPVPYLSKIFEKVYHVDVDMEDDHKNRVLFIPDNSVSIESIYGVWKHLKKRYNALLVGDMSTLLPEQNVILSKIDYLENGLKYIYKYIMESKAVICPASHWSMIINLQRVPMFSWCEYHPHIYRKNGMYSFDNENCICLAVNNVDIINRNIDKFLEEL